MAAGIGETLRVTRRQQRLSLADAASEIRVREPYLAALEEEKFAKLGGDVYVRAFLRGYSEFLGLDPDQIVEAYRRDFEHGGRARVDAPVAALPASATATSQWEAAAAPARWDQAPAPQWRDDESGDWDDEEPRPSFFPRAIILAGVVLLLLVVAVLGLRGRQAPIVADGGPATADVVIPTPQVEPSVVAEQPTAEVAPVPTPAPTASASPVPAAPAQGPLEDLSVELAVVEGPSWLRAEADGSVVEVGIFEPGTTFTWAPDESMLLRIGDPSKVRLVLNGVDQGLLGPERVPVNVEYRMGQTPTVTPG